MQEKDVQLTEEEKIEGQQEINAWFDGIPAKAADALRQLEEMVSKMDTFDLLSNISFYNHLHNEQEYTDYRGDRMFVVSELIALICLRRNYVQESAVDVHTSQSLLKELQELGHKYFGLMTFLQLKETRPEDDYSIEGIAFKNRRDETMIRNPALPEHHLMFSAELYAPLEPEIKKHFGFSVKESIAMRESMVKLVNDKFNQAREAAEEKGYRLSKEVFTYRANKVVPEGGWLSKENLDELNKLSRKQISEVCYRHCMHQLFFRLGEVFCFTANELSDASGCELHVAQNFLEQFSCTFPSVAESDELVGPASILKRRPLVEHAGRFMIPSIPLVTWCVETVVEAYFKSAQKLQERFKDIRHDFLLRKGIECFSQVLGDSVRIYTNLYYHVEGNLTQRFETDGIFLYERTLFIVEAKAHRISQPAKEGKVQRTERHMEQIVRDSYEQSVRTLNFIRSQASAEFTTDKNKKVVFRKSEFDEVILVSLVLEPIGNVTPLIRATNELGYFKGNMFPWIISVYDLQVIADHLEFPALLPHYIKRRKEFLERRVMQVFEETDLMSYYLYNRLYIEGMFRDAESKEVTKIWLDNETDGVNNYYMHKYRLKTPDPPKLRLKVPDAFLKVLLALEKATFSHRQELMQYLLDTPPSAADKFGAYIERVKSLFAKDGKKHDCSIMSNIWGNKVGFTFITNARKDSLDGDLFLFCRHKMETLGADVWVGIGDVCRSRSEFDIQSAFITKLPSRGSVCTTYVSNI